MDFHSKLCKGTKIYVHINTYYNPTLEWQYYIRTDNTIFAVVLPEVTLTGSDVTGSDVTGSDDVHMTGSDRMRMRNWYILYYYYSSSTTCSTVVQVPWLLEVTERVTLPRRDGRVCAFATESCAISALVGPFDWKWRYETSTVVTDGHVTPSWFPWVCAISALVGPFERK
jgi:hypothetical protein